MAAAGAARKRLAQPTGDELPQSLATGGGHVYDASRRRRWATGHTGLPLVDAAMRQLQQTGSTARVQLRSQRRRVPHVFRALRGSGYCSNRVRQNAASLLAKDLRLDWRAGAEWFQWLLTDHEVGVELSSRQHNTRYTCACTLLHRSAQIGATGAISPALAATQSSDTSAPSHRPQSTTPAGCTCADGCRSSPTRLFAWRLCCGRMHTRLRVGLPLSLTQTRN